ncbi:hypothetical protein ACTFIU_006238 [Dictyostelium citrinum]
MSSFQNSSTNNSSNNNSNSNNNKNERTILSNSMSSTLSINSQTSDSNLSISSIKSSSSFSLSTPLLPSLSMISSSSPSSPSSSSASSTISSSSSFIGSPKTSSSASSLSLKSSINGISSGVDKISLYSKDTQCTLSCDIDREREIREAELLFDSLPELVYYVTKINQWGKHQKRTLRLTSKGIENIRGDFVSSLYSYSAIKSIYNKDSETFVLEYHGASHSYVYKSSVGYQIVQEISSRLKLRRTTDKKKHSFDIALDYQKKLKAKNRQSEKVLLNLEQQQQLSQNIIDSNKHLSSPDINENSNNSNASGSSISTNSGGRTGMITSADDLSNTSVSPSSPPTVADNFEQDEEDTDDNVETKVKTVKRATKLSQLLGNTEEQRIQTEVDKIILSSSSPERKAIQQFMSNFNVLMKNPATAVMIVRQFIDTQKQNVLNERDLQLSKLLVKNNGFGGGANNSLSSSQVNDSSQEEISLPTIVEKSLEKSIIVRVQKQLDGIIAQQVAKEEQQLQEYISKLISKPQEFFGIKDDFISANCWKSAVLELSCLGRCEIPHDKLDTILSSARAIYNSLNYEKNLKNKDYQDYFLSADDFLPIYLYVVVNSGVKDLEFTNQFLWQLSDPDRLCGEGGYYLTVFSSILSLIKSLNMENFEKATIIDDLIPSINLKSDTLSNIENLNNSDEDSDSDSSSSGFCSDNNNFENNNSTNNTNNKNNNSENNKNNDLSETEAKRLKGRSQLGSSWHGATISNKKRTQSFNLGKDKTLS